MYCTVFNIPVLCDSSSAFPWICVLVTRKFSARRSLIHAANTSSISGSFAFLPPPCTRFFLSGSASKSFFCFLHCRTLFSSTKNLAAAPLFVVLSAQATTLSLNATSKERFFPTDTGIPPLELEPASSIHASFSLGFLRLLLPRGPNYLSGRVQILIEGRYYFIQHRQSCRYYSRVDTIRRAGTIRGNTVGSQRCSWTSLATMFTIKEDQNSTLQACAH